MFIHFFQNLDWVDLLMLAILVRVLFIGFQTGFITEFFKVFGVVVTLFVCFHYYTPLAHLFVKKGALPPTFMVAFAFFLLWAAMLLVCKLIRDGILLLVKTQVQPLLDKWGGIVLAVGRFFLVGSMVMFFFLTTGDQYLEAMTAKSFSRKYILHVAPNVYHVGCENFIGRLLPGQRVNQAVGEELEKVEAR